MFTKQTVIFTKDQLKDYLLKEKNFYTEFILKRLNRKLKNPSELKTQMHHIIPRHYGGLDANWNLIELFIEEHAYAHELLYLNYGSFYDLCASKMIRGQMNAGFQLLQKANQQKMKNENRGFYNSKFQQELSKRPRKKRKTYVRNQYIKTALNKGLIFEFRKTKRIVIIQPFTKKSITEVIDTLMSYPEMKDKKGLGKNPKKGKIFWCNCFNSYTNRSYR